MNHTEMEQSHPQSSAPTTFAVISENSHEEVIHQINKAQTELKIRLEQVSKLRIDCVKMQLNLLQLYKPQCLEILEMLRDISTPPEESCIFNDDDEVESCNNEASALLCAGDL
ncbi:uncharacterized protein LOC116847429 isoform X2 [Odontomachus brunneus]|uniref:uncharacterized protein LOC116847429 isoform X2 n=1 Tax=Odontomachus brunneus TaxID=486640 RepID=UPI0013F1CC1B|nr:uncharacterized protein LOC116847429 isoform X2 [Odontomachus brunneus]